MTPGGTDPRQTSFGAAVQAAVSDEHRRAVLAVLGESDARTLHLDEVTEAVSARLAPAAGRGSTDASCRRVRLVLHHVHLPQLGTCAEFAYHSGDGRFEVAAGGMSDALLSALEAASAGE